MELLNITPTPITEKEYRSAIQVCIALAVSRNNRYGNSIDIMKNSSVLDLVLMKLVRNRELAESDEKYYDEIIDSINYLVYLLIRRRVKNPDKFLQLELNLDFNPVKTENSTGKSSVEDEEIPLYPGSFNSSKSDFEAEYVIAKSKVDYLTVELKAAREQISNLQDQIKLMVDLEACKLESDEFLHDFAKAIKDGWVEPAKIAKGDPKVLLAGKPPQTPCRIIAEDYYLVLIRILNIYLGEEK